MLGSEDYFARTSREAQCETPQPALKNRSTGPDASRGSPLLLSKTMLEITSGAHHGRHWGWGYFPWNS